MLLSLAQTYAALALYAIVFSMADGILLSTFIVECMEVVDEESKRASLIGLITVCGAGFVLGAPPLFGECDAIQHIHCTSHLDQSGVHGPRPTAGQAERWLWLRDCIVTDHLSYRRIFLGKNSFMFIV